MLLFKIVNNLRNIVILLRFKIMQKKYVQKH